ncbi:hypothetical protein RHI9324_05350 [Rhizobium sp. CECT 9324]|nr:hypothetical protein RHI9324_05350 [Rhizobium sp. CECT 9324]
MTTFSETFSMAYSREPYAIALTVIETNGASRKRRDPRNGDRRKRYGAEL